MSGRRWPVRPRAHGRDRGAFTAELAAGLPALMLLLLAGLTAVGAVTAKGRCVDAAREGALLAARGGPGADDAARIAPAGARIDLSGDADSVTVTVRAPVPILGGHLPAITVGASATAAREPDGTGRGGAGTAGVVR
ncbi:TadE family type IV pilus minor pilin [Actinoplanes sp. NPDC049118]|uniref:TadE family type IV pilus minor pilin n=1 Tax=Actinoplanes sp. NPDC049118 TaxID=3155769 RepID=UPI0034025A44